MVSRLPFGVFRPARLELGGGEWNNRRVIAAIGRGSASRAFPGGTAPERIMKKAIVVALLALLGGLFGWRFYRRSQAEAAAPGAARASVVSVEVAPVTNLLLRSEQPVYGTLEARSSVVVAPKVGGRVRILAADLGDVVTNGQVLAVLDDEEYVQAVEQVRADRAVARASAEESRINLVLATQETVRVQALAAKGIVSDAEREAAVAQEAARRARLDVALATAEQREAALRLAELRLSYTRVTAEWSGGGTRAVGQRFVDEGALLRANDPLLTLVDLESLTAVVKVTAQEYARLSVGQAVDILADALPGERFLHGDGHADRHLILGGVRSTVARPRPGPRARPASGCRST
jgi:RND family efflux transporter MFP subunit